MLSENSENFIDNIVESIVLNDKNICIEEVIDKTELTLNYYDKWIKVYISHNWILKKVFLDNKNLKVDSTHWKEINIDYKLNNPIGQLKINPEKDIIEYQEWELAWQQLFTWHSATRESSKQWKRLPENENELIAIIDNIWIEDFLKKQVNSSCIWKDRIYKTKINSFLVGWKDKNSIAVVGIERYWVVWTEKVWKEDFFTVRCIEDS